VSSIPDFQPLYKQVYNVLVRRIAEGAWRPAQALPSEQALAGELGVSQGTVRKAMDALAADNLILRQQGKGSFVAEHTQEHALFRFFRLARPAPDGSRITPQLGQDKIRRRPANETERSKLKIRGDAQVVEIRRTRLVDGAPKIVEKIILPLSLFPGIDTQPSLPNTLYSLYQGVYGISIAVAKEELRAVLANKTDARTLGLAPGAPLLQVDRIAVALDGQPVEWRVSRCDTREFVYAVDVN
jgi:GntR family transcriptional regulator